MSQAVLAEANQSHILNQAGDSTPEANIEINSTRHFSTWLQEQKASLAFTTYQSGKIFWVGSKSNGELSIFERTFPRPMGLCASLDGQTLYLSTLTQIWRFENALLPNQKVERYDANYIPQVAYTTGDIDIHDMVIDNKGQLIFVNTLFSCLATISETYSFVPLWKPPFISKLAAEDRCHLNGLALKESKARYVTMVSQSDVAEGWRAQRTNGGIIMDITTNDIICENLSMPHSPRWYQDKLWLLESGTGYLGYLDGKTGKFEQVAFCPGYARGLSFINHYAIVATSEGRDNKTFQGLALDENLTQKQAQGRCGLHVIDLNTGDRVHGLNIEGFVNELYDVVVLPGISQPRAVGIRNQELCYMLKIPPQSFNKK